jgi:6-phosphogluconolactonase
VEVTIGKDPAAVARLAADWLAARVSADVAARGRCIVALSGGQTPWPMLEDLITRDVPWHAVQIVQVDERVVSMDDPRRNLAHIAELLCQRGRLEERQLHGIPVERPDVDLAAHEYLKTLESLGGSPPVLDVVQLGLGSDGHTASLFPGDAALRITDRDAVATGMQAGTRRVTLTFPCLNRARARLWLITGAEKAARVHELISGQGNLPAMRVSRESAIVFADASAAGSPRASASR